MKKGKAALNEGSLLEGQVCAGKSRFYAPIPRSLYPAVQRASGWTLKAQNPNPKRQRTQGSSLNSNRLSHSFTGVTFQRDVMQVAAQDGQAKNNTQVRCAASLFIRRG